MPNFVKVDTSDKYRTLLTDVLPYELPLWYTNHTMYNAFKLKLELYTAVSGLKTPNAKSITESLIPLDYKIFRGEKKGPRVLSIMHPISQIHVCNFYEKHASLIEYYCTKSKRSLRYPYKVSTKFFGKVNTGNKGDDGIEMVDDDRSTASSYFKYLKYPFLYRFFESYEYHKLEKRFSNMMQVDISKCFPSIYTHTIGWATKSKRMAKEGSQNSFDGDFDKLMQNTNYRETNGIIVGPEVSRIFSEIILQQVDQDILSILSDEEFEAGKDFDFRRYVDDYFVFFTDDKIGKRVYDSIGRALVEYKLHLNEAKTEYTKRPFATGISIAKNDLSTTVKSLFTSRENADGEIVKLSRPDWKANKFISKIKMTLAENQVSYHSISNYLLRSIEKQNISYLKKLESTETKIEDHHVNWLLVDIDILFFFHAMDIRIRTTDKLARQVKFILKKIEHWSNIAKEVIYKKTFDHIRQAIDIFIENKGDIYGLETLNLLVMLTLLPEKYKLDNERLTSYHKKICKHSEKNDFYFRFVTFMLYMKKYPDYNSLRTLLKKEALNVLLSDEDEFKSTHFFLLFFDFSSCSFIERSERLLMLNQIGEKRGFSINTDKKNQILAHDFIAPWRDEKYLQNVLSKREFVFAYE